MLVLFEITDAASVEMMLVSMPESFALLAFGIGLVVLAMLIRTLLSRGDVGNGERSELREERVNKLIKG
jgi:hypothetical protein